MENKLDNRITVRMTNKQIQMVEYLEQKVLPNFSKSEILRTILETLYANAKSAGY